VLSNLGRFPTLSRAKQFRVTAVFPVLNVEREPVIAVATANGHMSVTVTTDIAIPVEWIGSALRQMARV
jgi:hypothetical protein